MWGGHGLPFFLFLESKWKFQLKKKSFKRNKNEMFAELSCFVADFIKTITLGKINLEKFEQDFSHFRESGS